MKNLNNKTILITGGTGSFGKKFIETILKRECMLLVKVERQ